MTTSLNPFGARGTLTFGADTATIYRLPELERKGIARLDRLPFSIRVLLENALRFAGRGVVTEDHVAHLGAWSSTSGGQGEIPYMPARVVLQDFTGVPCVVDLAAMRDAMARMKGDPDRINPIVPCDLVIDHSVQVDYYGSVDAFQQNVDLEFERNRERYQLLKFAQRAFRNFRVVPPGTGIVHQVNLENLAPVVQLREQNGELTAYPDTCVGTDSHTTMINGLGVLGWGVGGIEAEAVMLGQPYFMLHPRCDRHEAGRGAPPGHHRHRPGADRDPDAAEEGRGGQVRRVLRSRPLDPRSGRPRDHRQHGAGVWRHHGILPGGP